MALSQAIYVQEPAGKTTNAASIITSLPIWHTQRDIRRPTRRFQPPDPLPHLCSIFREKRERERGCKLRGSNICVAISRPRGKRRSFIFIASKLAMGVLRIYALWYIRNSEKTLDAINNPRAHHIPYIHIIHQCLSSLYTYRENIIYTNIFAPLTFSFFSFLLLCQWTPHVIFQGNCIISGYTLFKNYVKVVTVPQRQFCENWEEGIN